MRDRERRVRVGELERGGEREGGRGGRRWRVVEGVGAELGGSIKIKVRVKRTSNRVQVMAVSVMGKGVLSRWSRRKEGERREKRARWCHGRRSTIVIAEGEGAVTMR